MTHDHDCRSESDPQTRNTLPYREINDQSEFLQKTQNETETPSWLLILNERLPTREKIHETRIKFF